MFFAQDVGEGPGAHGVYVDLRRALRCVLVMTAPEPFGFAVLVLGTSRASRQVGIDGDVRQGLHGEEVFCLPLRRASSVPGCLGRSRHCRRLLVPLDDAAAYDRAAALREEASPGFSSQRELPGASAEFFCEELAAVRCAGSADVFLTARRCRGLLSRCHDTARGNRPTSGAVSHGGSVVRGPDTLVLEKCFLRFHSCLPSPAAFLSPG